MKKFIQLTILGLSLFSLFSCSDKEKVDDDTADIEKEKAVMETKFNAQNVFNTVPDRTQIIKLIDENKVQYNPDILNNPLNVSKYSVEFQKAANLGIYGTDLSVANTFEQTQESLMFLKCVNTLATNLGVSKAFDQSMFDRMDANKSNKDSTLQIITGAFKNCDEILKNNGRSSTSAIILAGAWIEGLFVGCSMANELKTESLIKAVLNQTESLHNLIVMLEACNLKENELFLVSDLKNLLVMYKSKTDLKNITIETVQDISNSVTALRQKLTALN
ncbi:MAG: hypothetical protein JSU07_06605 [Bacteroidetes bacterium]|nr:hypothetical protein [Bacteroidota bacterium]